MSNVFTKDNDTVFEIMQLKMLYHLLTDYKETYPKDDHIHEAWLQVMDRLDDMGAEA